MTHSFFIFYTEHLFCVPGHQRQSTQSARACPLALCSRALGAGAMSCVQELRSKELRSRTFVKRSWELGRTMLMGAGSYALYHARAKMSIGAAKIFLFFLYIYLCKLYHTFALLSTEYKIKKRRKRIPSGILFPLGNLLYIRGDALLIQLLKLPLRHEQLPQQPQLLHVLLPFQPFLHTLPRTLLLHLQD